ncbi:MAG: hypothetical protein AB1778_05975 [Candidatus Bipolaricaulota bacterium]
MSSRDANANARSSSVVGLQIATNHHIDVGVGIVLACRPLTLLVPAHLVTGLSSSQARRVLVDGADLGLPQIVRSPAAEQDELAVVRFHPEARLPRRPICLPRTPPALRIGDDISLRVLDGPNERDVVGHVTMLRTDDGRQWITTDTQVSRGHSGSPLVVAGRLAAVCQGKAPESSERAGDALLIRLSQETLRELRKLSGVCAKGRRNSAVLACMVALVGVGTAIGLLGGDPFPPAVSRGGVNPDPVRAAGAANTRSHTRALYVHGIGAIEPEFMKAQLEAVGFSVDTAAIAPEDLTPYEVVVCHVNAPDPGILEDYLDGGGGVVLLEATPYYLGVADIASWFGAATYANADDCIEAKLVSRGPLPLTLDVGDVVAKSACAWGGPAAMTGLAEDSVLLAEWASPQGYAFAFARTLPTNGRVYYQAQFAGAYEGERAWDLFLTATRWTAGFYTTVPR